MTVLIVIIVVVVLVAAAVAGAAYTGDRRLRAAFGPELDTVAQQHGGTRQVSRELRRRRRAHDALDLTPLGPEDRAHFTATWEHVQGEFLDDPALALSGADQLIATVLKARGYPDVDPEEQRALLSVEHAGSLADYRAAQETNRRAHEDPQSVPTEDLRRAMMAYLALFTELTADRTSTVTSRMAEDQEATR